MSPVKDITRWSTDVRQKIGTRLPFSEGRTKSIGGAGQRESGRTTESSLSPRNNFGNCLISCLQPEKVHEVMHLKDSSSGGARCHVICTAIQIVAGKTQHIGLQRLQALPEFI